MLIVRLSKLSIGGLLFAVLLLASCSTKVTNDQPTNIPPRVEIVNIPPSGSHFTNSPLINWYGTDADGRIVAYEYAVVPFTSIPETLDTRVDAAVRSWAAQSILYPGTDVVCEPACWVTIIVLETESPTRQTVQLVAGTEPRDTVAQYFFVRAVDNDSARSEIRFSIYTRNNNPPETEIKSVPEKTGYYDRPDTAGLYKGILMEWAGKDELDFPNNPDDATFDFFYELYGPFTQAPAPYDTFGNFFDTNFVFDTLTARQQGKRVLQSRDPATGSAWVKADGTRLFNLWRNELPSDTTRVGYFVFKVTARDDAFAPDPTPAYKAFMAVDPKFENTLLVHFATSCVITLAPGELYCTREIDPTEPGEVFVYGDSDLEQFYYAVFQQAGYPVSNIRRGISTSNPNTPSKAELAKYKVYVMIDDGDTPRFDKQHFIALTGYLDIGGSVWVWSPAPFGGSFYTSVEPELKPFPTFAKDNVDLIPYRYFDVLAEWRGGWKPAYIRRFQAPTCDTCTIPVTNEEFIGAEALAGKGFRDFTADVRKAQLTYRFVRLEPPLKPHQRVNLRAVPNANYFIRGVFSEPLFLFKSYYGDFVPDSVKAWIPGLQGRVCAMRYDSGIFRTSLFGFSMWCMQQDDAADIVRTMMQWFLRPR